jgi:hypothetical protein
MEYYNRIGNKCSEIFCILCQLCLQIRYYGLICSVSDHPTYPGFCEWSMLFLPSVSRLGNDVCFDCSLFNDALITLTKGLKWLDDRWILKDIPQSGQSVFSRDSNGAPPKYKSEALPFNFQLLCSSRTWSPRHQDRRCIPETARRDLSSACTQLEVYRLVRLTWCCCLHQLRIAK